MAKVGIRIQSDKPKKPRPVSERGLDKAAIRDKIECAREAREIAELYGKPCDASEFM